MSGRGRDSAVVSLWSRNGRYKSRRRNNTGGDAEPATDRTADNYNKPTQAEMQNLQQTGHPTATNRTADNYNKPTNTGGDAEPATDRTAHNYNKHRWRCRTCNKQDSRQLQQTQAETQNLQQTGQLTTTRNTGGDAEPAADRTDNNYNKRD